MSVVKFWSRLQDLYPWSFQDKHLHNFISLDLFEQVDGLEDVGVTFQTRLF